MDKKGNKNRSLWAVETNNCGHIMHYGLLRMRCRIIRNALDRKAGDEIIGFNTPVNPNSKER